MCIQKWNYCLSKERAEGPSDSSGGLSVQIGVGVWDPVNIPALGWVPGSVYCSEPQALGVLMVCLQEATEKHMIICFWLFPRTRGTSFMPINSRDLHETHCTLSWDPREASWQLGHRLHYGRTAGWSPKCQAFLPSSESAQKEANNLWRKRPLSQALKQFLNSNFLHDLNRQFPAVLICQFIDALMEMCFAFFILNFFSLSSVSNLV